MADDSSKPSIPAWQEAAKRSESKSTDIHEAARNVPDSAAAAATTTTTAPIESSVKREDVESDTAHRERVRAFLTDPGVKNSSDQTKRTFLLSKDIPAHIIDGELEKLKPSNNVGASTTVAVATEQPPVAQEIRTSAAHEEASVHAAPAPIITYPEFLSNAHRPAPLVTPARVLATTYVAAATAALAYAASTYLVKPMIASLTGARHDFATHTNDKVEELNAKMAQMASKVPAAKPDQEHDSNSSDSDPTELFARDTGTQTEAGALSESSKVTIFEPSATATQVNKLKELQKHMDDILAGVKKEESVTGEREENTRQLRHYLDSLAYGSGGINVWSNTNGQFGWEQTAAEQHREKEKKNDVIEELKKEIRSVKGVLLSAKRFPPTGRAPRVDTLA